MGAHWREPQLLQIAHAYEQAAGWTRTAVAEAGRVTAAG
jgi:Asp-tRNA(Asn)/Glu-tRNA(Gln) amidotransferase A subunit family amidase